MKNFIRERNRIEYLLVCFLKSNYVVATHLLPLLALSLGKFLLTAGAERA